MNIDKKQTFIGKINKNTFSQLILTEPQVLNI